LLAELDDWGPRPHAPLVREGVASNQQALGPSRRVVAELLVGA